jgi:hypothetical protein
MLMDVCVEARGHRGERIEDAGVESEDSRIPLHATCSPPTWDRARYPIAGQGFQTIKNVHRNLE